MTHVGRPRHHPKQVALGYVRKSVEGKEGGSISFLSDLFQFLLPGSYLEFLL